jgi:hypothetical protein
MVADRATRHVLRASAAAGAILDWPHAAELHQLRDELVVKLDANELPPRM